MTRVDHSRTPDAAEAVAREDSYPSLRMLPDDVAQDGPPGPVVADPDDVARFVALARGAGL